MAYTFPTPSILNLSIPPSYVGSSIVGLTIINDQLYVAIDYGDVQEINAVLLFDNNLNFVSEIISLRPDDDLISTIANDGTNIWLSYSSDSDGTVYNRKFDTSGSILLTLSQYNQTIDAFAAAPNGNIYVAGANSIGDNAFAIVNPNTGATIDTITGLSIRADFLTFDGNELYAAPSVGVGNAILKFTVPSTPDGSIDITGYRDIGIAVVTDDVIMLHDDISPPRKLVAFNKVSGVVDGSTSVTQVSTPAYLYQSDLSKNVYIAGADYATILFYAFFPPTPGEMQRAGLLNLNQQRVLGTDFPTTPRGYISYGASNASHNRTTLAQSFLDNLPK